ncbi:MAG TPA: S41 family peptidase [Candidatus Cloacimonadota bacterium]|nr:S41 family peptidase [Candidatus Cloacimonadota bacterium]HPS38291.1 S41 family peptidase [Candidatus Cloacimonadota bacterium]
MTRNLLITMLLLILTCTIFGLEPDFARDPAISPNGDQICFVYDGDLWIVPFKGGDARRLTATEGAEWGPAWSPAGNLIAFNSNREGQSYVYTIAPEGGSAQPVFRESFTVVDWFKDGKSLLTTRYSHRNGNGFYRLPLDGTRPVLLAEVGDRYATLSPDNTKIIFNRYGDPFREAYQGSMNGDLWEFDLNTKAYTRLTSTPLTERYPRYAYSSNSIYYCASDSERFQLYRVDQGDFSKPRQLSSFPVWSVRDITIARTNDRIVFELFNEIWAYDPTRIAANPLSKVVINIPEDRWTSSQVTERLDNNFWDYTVSDDKLVLGFQAAYDVYAMPFKGGEPKRISNDHAGNSNLLFLPGSHKMLLQRMNQGRDDLCITTVDSLCAVTPVSWFADRDFYLENIYRDSQDNIIIAYRDNLMGGKIALTDKDLAEITPLDLPGAVSSNFAINKAGTYAVFAVLREDTWMRELYLYEIATKTSRKILTDNLWIDSIVWTPDDKSVLMTRANSIYRLDLVPRDEFEVVKDNWKEILTKLEVSTPVIVDTLQADSLKTEETRPEPIQDTLTEAPKTTLDVVWEGIDHRLFPVISKTNKRLWVLKCNDDTTFVYVSSPTGDSGDVTLNRINIYGSGDDEVTVLGKRADNIKYIGSDIYFLDGSTLRSYNLDTGKKASVSTVFDFTYDEKILNKRVFEQVWGAFGLNFYDPAMHGKDWEAVYKQYAPYVEKARNMEDISMIVDEMIGDVNASHTGFYPRQERIYPTKQSAWLGVDFDYSSVLPVGIKVRTVLPDTRLANLYRLKAGALILSIDGVKITAQTPLDSLLADKAGKKINISFEQDGKTQEAVLTGLTWYEQRNLWYNYKVMNRRDQVKSLSGGRIGYIHIPSMGIADWNNFYRELFRDNTDKEALIIDVRGNSGGRIHDQIISLLLKRPYALSSSRRYSKDPAPEPSEMWAKPSIVLVDEHSFSDGEIFPIVYQQLKLGKVVGYPSSGAVIGTWEFELIDGSSMRMPGSGWYKLDGTNMEGTGAKPDIIVELTPNDIAADRDPQLVRAVSELMQELGSDRK